LDISFSDGNTSDDSKHESDHSKDKNETDFSDRDMPEMPLSVSLLDKTKNKGKYFFNKVAIKNFKCIFLFKINVV